MDTVQSKGHYLGTEIDASWWRRYKKDNYFMRGTGVYWLDDENLYFLRHLTEEPITIPFSKLQKITMGSWHAGKWTGRPIVKVHWTNEGKELCSGFAVSKNKDIANGFKIALEGKISDSVAN